MLSRTSSYGNIAPALELDSPTITFTEVMAGRAARDLA